MEQGNGRRNFTLALELLCHHSCGSAVAAFCLSWSHRVQLVQAVPTKCAATLQQVYNIVLIHRRRIKTEEKVSLQDGIYLIPCHVAVCFALEDLNNRMNCTRMSCKKKMYILSLSFKIVLGKIASAARNYINAATQTSLRSPFPFLLFISFFYVLIPCYRMFFLNLYVLPYTSTYCRIKCSFCEIFS